MVAIKPGQIDKTQALSLLNQFFEQYLKIVNGHEMPQSSDFEETLSHDFRITSNTKLKGKNIDDFLSRIATFQKRYSRVEFSDFNIEPLISGNHLIFQYDLNLTGRDGKQIRMNLMAIARIEDQRITKWDQVAHEDDSSDWDD